MPVYVNDYVAYIGGVFRRIPVGYGIPFEIIISHFMHGVVLLIMKINRE